MTETGKPAVDEKKLQANKRFERIIYAFLAVLIVVRFYGAYQDSKHMHSAMIDAVPAPNFTWRDFESNPHQFNELSGKVIVLHFWASWCGPCRQEFPALLRAAQELKGDAVFLTITGDDDDIPAKKFIQAAKLAAGVQPDNTLYGFDAMKSIIYDIFQTTAFPETFIIDPQFRMRRKLAGMQEWNDPKLINYIRDLKTAKPAIAEVPKPK